MVTDCHYTHVSARGYFSYHLIPNNIKIQLFPAAYTPHMLYYVSSLVNPLIYAIRMEEFRKAVKELFCAKKPDSSRVYPSEVLVMQKPLPGTQQSNGHTTDHNIPSWILDQGTARP